MFGTRKLGKTSTQRKAMLRQQVTDLLENGKMETTFERAKEVQPVVALALSCDTFTLAGISPNCDLF